MEAEEASLNNQDTLSRINAFLGEAFQSSCEGIMVKSLDIDAGYFPTKRYDSWLKVVCCKLSKLNIMCWKWIKWC